MNNQFIQTAVIKWDKIAEDSYLRKIEAFSLTTLQFWRVVFVITGGSAAHEGPYASHSAVRLPPRLPDRRLRRTGIFMKIT